MGRVKWGLVAQTVLVDFDFTRDALAVHGWADEDVVHDCWAAV